MRRLIVGGAAAALIAGGAGMALADGGGPAFNGNNDHGLCTAFLNHQGPNDDGTSTRGQGHGQDSPTPFVNLQPPAGYSDGDQDPSNDVMNYCLSILNGNSQNGNGNGNSNPPGKSS